MGEIVLLLGGARSGKTDFAISLVPEDDVAYLATARPLDDEMRARIEEHRKSRPKRWTTDEASEDLAGCITEWSEKEAIIVDCLTVYFGQKIAEGLDEPQAAEEAERIADTAACGAARVIFISNEVGMGVVPVSKDGRRFRDVLGRVNQVLAERADRVYLLAAGIPVLLKGQVKV